MRKLQLREVRCRTLLHRLEFGDSSGYTANFYRGCCHGCVYCYVPSLIHDERDWGFFVDAKVNSPEVLAMELRQVQKNVVFLSSATDPYQAPEARYGITRRCLQVLLKRGFPVSILTRSPLVLRDLDLLKKFDWVRVGLSISTVPDRFYEPGVPSLERRIDVLKRLSSVGIQTWVSLAPIVPQLILTDLERLIEKLAEAGVSSVSPGILRFQGYEESKAMFERITGTPSAPLMRGGDETLARVQGLLRRYSLDRSDELLRWSAADEYLNLDQFVRSR